MKHLLLILAVLMLATCGGSPERPPAEPGVIFSQKFRDADSLNRFSESHIVRKTATETKLSEKFEPTKPFALVIS